MIRVWSAVFTALVWDELRLYLHQQGIETNRFPRVNADVLGGPKKTAWKMFQAVFVG
jgi:hypothetical protein